MTSRSKKIAPAEKEYNSSDRGVSKKSLSKKLKIVMVEWVDITETGSIWVNVTGQEDKDHLVSNCKTVGFLVKKTGKVIITAQNYCLDEDGGEQWGGMEIIPRGTVKKIVILGSTTKSTGKKK